MAVSKSQTAFITLTKSFDYRGARENWSNVYHLDSTPPASSDWAALFNEIWNLEKQMLTSEVQVESGTGHEAGEPPQLVWEYDVAPPGEGGLQGAYVPSATEYNAPGDAAMWVRWGTDLKNNRGKPIYLRNYYHGVFVMADGDTVVGGQQNVLAALGQAFQQGIVANGRTYRRTGPNHGTPQNFAQGPFATTRTLKRRGKRKKVPQSFEIMGGPSGTDFFKWFLGKVPSLIP